MRNPKLPIISNGLRPTMSENQARIPINATLKVLATVAICIAVACSILTNETR